MGTKERLERYLRHIGVSNAEFCRSIGVSSAYISSMRKSIQPDKLQRVKQCYNTLNTDWLLTGQGEMLRALDEHSEYPSQRKHNEDEHISGVVQMMNSAIQSCKDILEQCKVLNDKSSALIAHAQKVMDNAVQLNSDMQKDHAETRGLYDKLETERNIHMERSRKYLADEMLKIRQFQDALMQKLDKQAADAQAATTAIPANVVALFDSKLPMARSSVRRR